MPTVVREPRGAYRPRQQRGTPGNRVAALIPLGIAFIIAALFAYQVVRPIPTLAATADIGPTVQLAGAPPEMPWPSAGGSSVSIRGLGSLGSHGVDEPHPIASTTKIMTALLILENHPLAPGDMGPTLTIGEQEVAEYRQYLALDQSIIPVRVGMELTERQALEALLLPSANNIATLLGRWDAGSEAAFVQKMNARAAELGMAHTHFEDASGYSPRTVSTADDLVRLATRAMADATFAEIVAMPSTTLPEVGEVKNVNSALGQDGIVGIKTGSTPEAGGCLVFDSRGEVDGQTVDAIGAVMSQADLAQALDEARNLGLAARNAVQPITVLSPDQAVGHITQPWGGRVAIVPAADVSLLGWGGLEARVEVHLDPEVAAPRPAGSKVGTAVVRLADQERSVDLVTAQPLEEPPLTWKLTRRPGG